MDHRDPVDITRSPKTKQKDPVCGMDVNPASARHKTLHDGKEYFFCSAGCLAKFQTNPEKVLSSTPRPMGSALVSLGGTAGAPAPPELIMPTLTKPAPAPVPLQTDSKKSRAYVCPMCPEVRQLGPGPCPKCGMALEPELPALAATKTEYTCPMHQEIVRGEPGSCPICGMALEQRTVTLEEDNPELRDMTKRFWISLALTVPLLAITMGSMLWPHFFVRRVDTLAGYRYQFFLRGRPAMARAVSRDAGGFVGRLAVLRSRWASLVTRNLNMFTLIGMGTGVAYAFSVVGLFFPGFPGIVSRHGGELAVYFEAAAAIITLVLLGQVMELRARSRTASAIRALLDLAPKMARVFSDDGTDRADVPLDQVEARRPAAGATRRKNSGGWHRPRRLERRR